MNQYCRYMGEAVEQNGGRLDKFIGDGVMALFGIDPDAETGARQALATARSMSLALDHMNEALKSDLEQPMKLGIGVHVGDVIIGEMGYRNVVSFCDRRSREHNRPAGKGEQGFRQPARLFGSHSRNRRTG